MDISDLSKRMDGAVNSFHKELSGLRTGRASVALVDGITVEVYGSEMPLAQVATISTPEARTISIQVWDASNAPAVEKAILASGLGITPNRDGTLIRLNLPDLTEERRKELVKLAHKYAEEKRIAIRNVRRDGMDELKKLEKDKKISEDEHKKKSEVVQKLTDSFMTY
jgi:ribosome recycling factor